MTDTEIRIAIETMTGWPTDYCHDLNAMFDAEETIKGNPDLWVRWGNELFAVTKPNGDNPFACYHANARQRAEALLRTWGMWKE